jgi:hypothetical protein
MTSNPCMIILQCMQIFYYECRENLITYLGTHIYIIFLLSVYLSICLFVIRFHSVHPIATTLHGYTYSNQAELMYAIVYSNFKSCGVGEHILKSGATIGLCPVLCCPVRYRRPNGWADPAQHWQKYSLGQCDEDRESAIACAHLCARCAGKHARITTYPS